MSTFIYHAQENVIREKARMKEPKMRNHFLDQYETDYAVWRVHIASLKQYNCLPSCREVWKDGEDVTGKFETYDSDKYYFSKCDNCGWHGSSELLHGGGQIADTGDYADCYCPNCGSINISDDSSDSYAGILAYPIKQEETQDELWFELYNIIIDSHRLCEDFRFTIQKGKVKFTITRNK